MKQHIKPILKHVSVAMLVLSLLQQGAQADSEMIRQYQFTPRPDGKAYQLVMKQVSMPQPGKHEVLVRIHATSLNGGYDLVQLNTAPGQGSHLPGHGHDLTGAIPLADGAGEIIATGPEVTRFKIGDRVAATFFERWIDGDRTPDVLASARGGNNAGTLSEVIVTSEESLVAIPDHLSYEEAATLPTSGVTAWVGLFKYGGLRPGNYVLLEGTGGVSTFGMLFAAAAGARPIITSSSDAKLKRARKLGAFATVNYRTNPEWQERVRVLTGGIGVKQVLEVGGRDTLPRAFQALAPDGHIALIGELSGMAQPVSVGALMRAGAHLSAVYVGSRADFEAMNAFISKHNIHPVIDRVFSFEQAPEAFDLMAHGSYMGKIVIRVD